MQASEYIINNRLLRKLTKIKSVEEGIKCAKNYRRQWKQDNPEWRPAHVIKDKIIWDWFDAGKEPKEVSRMMQEPYENVKRVRRKWLQQKKEDELAKARDGGMTVDEIIKHFNKNVRQLHKKYSR